MIGRCSIGKPVDAHRRRLLASVRSVLIVCISGAGILPMPAVAAAQAQQPAGLVAEVMLAELPNAPMPQRNAPQGALNPPSSPFVPPTPRQAQAERIASLHL